MIVLLLILSALPGLGLMVFFYLKDKYEPEPRGHVVTAFLYGLLVLIPALYTGGKLSGLVGREFLILGGIRGVLYKAFLVAALSEEGWKFLLFLLTIARWREFDEPFDGIVYGVALSLGLGTVENIVYVFQAHVGGDSPLMLAVFRGVLSVPAHALYGAVMGYFVGRAKFEESRKKTWLYCLTAFLVAWLFHGLYDLLCAYLGSITGWSMLIGISLVMWAVVLRMMVQATKHSPFVEDTENKENVLKRTKELSEEREHKSQKEQLMHDDQSLQKDQSLQEKG